MLTIWWGNGVCWFTRLVGTDPRDEFSRGEHTRGCHDGPFPLHPGGLTGLEPGPLARSSTAQEATAPLLWGVEG
jgi:hypothetical protein